jgi:alpha-L-arabinofuranosidase
MYPPTAAQFPRRFSSHPQSRDAKSRPPKSLLAQSCIEPLEQRLLMTAVSWSSPSGGSWNTPSNWSNNAIPAPADIVTINQPGNIQITLTGSDSVTSLNLAGDTLQLTSGTLSIASAVTVGSGASLTLTTSTLTLPPGSSLTNSGSITVNPGSTISDKGSYVENASASLTLPSGALASGVGTNLIGNPGFETPAASGSTTTPNLWGQWSTAYVSTAYAHAGTQSLFESGANSGAYQSFSVTPGVSYSASVWALNPSTSPLTGSQGDFLNISFSDASGNTISSPTAWVNLVNANSAANTWINSKTTLVAPPNAVKAGFYLQIGPYTGLSGTAGGSAYLDDAQFGPTALTAATLTAASVSNSGAITLGDGATVTSAGTFTQSSTGTVNILLGGPPAGNFFGALTAAGAASLAGTLSATLVNGYTPTISDAFTLLNYASETGAFTTYSLPYSGSYVFEPSVNPTYAGISALPTTLSTTINTGTALASASNNLIGANLAYWDNSLTTTQTQQMVEAAGLSIFRFPGGSSSDDFHFNVAANYSDPVANTIPQFAQFITAVGGTGVVTTDYGSGSPQEAEAELAYLDGSPTDTTVIGNGIEWNDSTGAWQTVNWQTVGYWAGLRAATPLQTNDGLNFLRINQPAPFTDINDWEIGNEEYGSWEIDHHGTAGPGGVSTGAQHDPATYAKFAAVFANFDASDPQLPSVKVGIDSQDPTGAADSNWTKNVLTDLHSTYGLVPGFISDHSYSEGNGFQSDSYLLNNTVSDPSSLLDWSTRYTDYQTLLQSILGAASSSVKVMATEFNNGGYGKEMTNLVNGIFIADSIGSLLNSGYSGGLVWDLRNSWSPDTNDSSAVYGWRNGGDEGLLGDPSLNLQPSTGPYVPYPSYFGEQLASKIAQTGGEAVSAVSNYGELTVYSVMEPNGHLELMVLNKNPDANITEPFTLAGFAPASQATIWQYGESQDYAQSQSTTGASSLANFTTSLSLTGNNFSFTFSPYSMTVIDLAPAPAPVASTFLVNDGSPQRAMVTSLTVTFNEPVNLSSNAITLNLLSQTGGAPTPMAFVLTPQTGGATYILTFTAPGDIGGSLPDGAYQLTINAPGVTSTQGIPMTATRNFTFWRLYGDFTGSGAVNGTDFSLLAANFGTNTTSADWFIDYDNNGIINGSDFASFAARFGHSISIPAVLQTTITTDAALTPETASPSVVLSRTAPIPSHQKKAHHRK